MYLNHKLHNVKYPTKKIQTAIFYFKATQCGKLCFACEPNFGATNESWEEKETPANKIKNADET
jgi:hypothetical protein